MNNYIRKIEEPKGHIVVVGDIHGHWKETTQLLNKIQCEIDLFSPDNLVIFLGDYIDRGDENREVLQYLISLKKAFPNSIYLRGNHEDMFLDSLGYEGMYGNMHYYNGGSKVYEQYGVPEEYYGKNLDGTCRYYCTKEELKSCFPKEHIDFLLQTEYCVYSKNFIFVHAGIAPREMDRLNVWAALNCGNNNWLTLEEQDQEDFVWIRDGFLGKIHRLNKIVVHGHTPAENVYFNMPYEIGLDTGIAYGRKLSAIALKMVDRNLESEVFEVEKI